MPLQPSTLNTVKPTDPPTSRLIVTDPSAIQFLQQATRSRYLLPFVARASPLKPVADQLDVPVGKLAYWVRKMLGLNLIRLERIEGRKGSPIKFYRAVADELVVPVTETSTEHDVALLEAQFGPIWERLLHSSVLTARGLTPEWQIRLFRDQHGLHRLEVEPRQDLESLGMVWRQPLNHWNLVRLHPHEAQHLRAELEAVLHRYHQRADEPGLEPYLMHVALVRDHGPAA